jgi:hypothetical protein
MEGLVAWLTAVSLLIGIITVMTKRITNAIANFRDSLEKGMADHQLEVLKLVGLIKEPPGEDWTMVWPNGSSTLPDFLGHIWDSLEGLQSGMESIRAGQDR